MNIVIYFLMLSLSYTLLSAECIKKYDKNGCDKIAFDIGDNMQIHQYKVIYDKDQDGIVDSLDKCPQTPINNVVDEWGCTVVAKKVFENKIEKAISESPDIDATTITLSVKFDTAKYNIKEQYQDEINEFATFMITHTQYIVHIVGHTDSTNLYNKNIELSFNRANAVKDMLISLGVPTERITTDGVGPNEPVATNTTAEGRAQNRRIEVTLKQKDEKAL